MISFSAGERNVPPHAQRFISLAKNGCAPDSNVDDWFPDDLSSKTSVVYPGSRGPVLDGVLRDHLTPAGLDGRHDKLPLSALHTDTADSSTEVVLTDHSNARAIDGWQADLFPFTDNAAPDPKVPIRRSNPSRIPSVRLRRIGENTMPQELTNDS